MELINIVSSEIIKPSSPTPQRLRIYKLSFLDQICTDCFFPIIYFYSGACKDNTIKNNSDRLKKSLSDILTHYYPFAGRVKDDFSAVDCDDYGAAFVEARVAGELSEILKKPDDNFLQQLVPFKLNGKPSFPVSLIVQVTYFDCGGMAICLGLSHIIADITTAANFIKSWATMASATGSTISNNIVNAIPDFTSVFPPMCLSSMSSDYAYVLHSPPTEITIRRFTFDGSKIAALSEKIGYESSSGYHPTRFEVVTAVILGGVMTTTAAKQGDDEFNYTNLVAVTAVNLRKRMNPQLSEQSVGSVCLATTANWPMEKTTAAMTHHDYNMLTEKLHQSISMMNDENVRKIQAADGGILNYIKTEIGEFLTNNKVKNFSISSWCRQPFYEADFGWGKPIWVSSVIKAKDNVLLLDSCDGKGIEALVGLSNQDMAKFEQDPGILTYASFNPKY